MSSQLTNTEVYAEMARIFLLNHRNENWQDVKNWGLFRRAQVARQIKTGALRTYQYYAKSGIWVYPTCETYLTKIKPLIEKYNTLELADMCKP